MMIIDPKNLVFLIGLAIMWQPRATTTAQAQLPSQTAQPAALSANSTQSDHVNALALKLIEARTDDERKSLLDRETEFVTERLTQVLLTQARIYLEKGSPTGALAILHLAQSVAEPIGDKLGLAQALTRAGNIYRMQGDYDRALDYLRRALPLHESMGNKQGVFYTLSFITTINSFTGDYDLELAQRLLALAEESKNKEWIATSLSQIGAYHFSLGSYAQAFDYHQKSLTIYEEITNKPGIAFALHGIGNAYRMYGNYDQALSYFQRSLALSEEIGNADLSIRTLHNLGALHRAQGDYMRAEEYLRKSINLIETSRIGNFSGNNFWLSLALINLGEISRLRGDYQQALAYLQRSISLAESSDSRDPLAYALGRTAAVLVSQRDFTRGLEAASRAVTIAKQTRGRDAQWRANLEAGKAHRGLDQITQARREFEEAISIVESVRADVLTNEARSSYFATTQELYEQYIDLLMQLHKQEPSGAHNALALQANERARARSLLDTLAEAHADIRRGVDPKLLESERRLEQQLNVAAGRQTRLLSGKHTREQVAAVKKEVDELTPKLQELRAQIRLSSPHYAALTQPVPLALREIQSEILDPETALLEFALGEERSYLWVVTPSVIKSFELPKRAEIERDVRRLVELLGNGKRWTTSSTVNADYAKTAGLLARTLLPFGILSQLKISRLVIVADGALQYLPFGALLTPAPNVQSAKSKNEFRNADYGRPLIADFEIVSLPSASTLAVLRRETASRAPATKSIAILADPVFEESDERVKPTFQPAKLGNGQATAGLRDVSLDNSEGLLERALTLGAKKTAVGSIREGSRITRLPFTRLEADGILAESPLNQSLKATDFRANRETATSPELAHYRFVHFATHGILNSEHPELSGVVLSLVNEKGQQVDGFLRLHEIYNLNLPADLVVLSACQTGLGKEIRGEGLIGLTRGFMYAGAPRVVASLWKVDDAATAELMKRFYRGMLKENLPPAAALRAAKVEMWKQKRWQSPFYWAAFELQGEWK